MSGNGPTLHKMLKPLEWLLGKWTSEDGQGSYPTISSDFKYGEELVFSHIGQPNIQFVFNSWHTTTKKPLHREVGFLRIKPDTNEVALIIAQNIGLCEIEEGTVTGESMKTTSHTLGRIGFAIPPQTTKISREFKKVGDCLEQLLDMETEKTPMTKHLRIKYNKVIEEVPSTKKH